MRRSNTKTHPDHKKNVQSYHKLIRDEARQDEMYPRRPTLRNPILFFSFFE